MRLVVLTLLLAACGSHEDVEDPADLSVAEDLALDETPATGAYAGSLGLGSSISIEGSAALDGGVPVVTATHMTGSVGTIDYQGTTYPAVAYEHIGFGMYDLAPIIATTKDGFLVSYAYCQMGQLTYFYTEALDLAPTPNPAMGTCSFVDGSVLVDAMFDMPTMLGYGPLADLADVTGEDLEIHGGRGTMKVANKTYDVYVFTTVDCSACGGAGWHELHVTIRDASTLAFGILYLAADAPTKVQLAYGIRLDTPKLWPSDRYFSSSWTLK